MFSEVPAIVARITSESPSTRPLPSHATPDNVSCEARTPISLDFEYTDNRTNSNDGVTERQLPGKRIG